MGKQLMHYSNHRLTASAAYVTTLTYALTNDQCARLVCPLVSSSKTKPVSLQFSYSNPGVCMTEQIIINFLANI